MPRKIIDIFPPLDSSFHHKKNAHQKAEQKRRQSRGEKRFWSKTTFFGALLLLTVAAVAYLHFFAAKTQVVIWPATEVFEVSETVIVDVSLQAPDFGAKAIPGRVFQAENVVSDEFASEGSVLKKAEGVLRLYNSYTTQTETWLKGTRFVSSEGKLFLSKDRIQVPGATITGGRLTSSFIDVPVVAAEGGEEYNIGPSKFSVAAFRGTARFTSYYGESSSAMAGGGVFKQVTQDDLERAQSALKEKAAAAAQKEISGMTTAGFILLPAAVETEVLENVPSVEPGAEVEKFNLEIKTRTKGLAFEKMHIENYLKDVFLAQVPPEKSVHQESIKFEYQAKSTNLNNGKMTLGLAASANVYRQLDLDSLKIALAGRSLEEARVLLAGQPEIVRSEVETFPFWLRKIPKNLDRIKVDLMVE